MKRKEIFVELMMTFFVVTACVTMLQGIFGSIFMPDAVLSWDAFYSPPIFGLLSALLSLVTYSSKELTMKQEFCRKILHLILIEVMVLALNMISGNNYSAALWVVVVICVAVIYVIVNLILYMNDQKSAKQFNKNLKKYQEKAE